MEKYIVCKDVRDNEDCLYVHQLPLGTTFYGEDYGNNRVRFLREENDYRFDNTYIPREFIKLYNVIQLGGE